MSEQPIKNSARRLFSNGTALKIDVTRVNGGRNNKFHPQSAEDAADLLRPQIMTALREMQELPDEYIAENLYFEVRVLPNYLSASAFPEKLLKYLDADLVGVRSDESLYKTKAKPAKLAHTKRLILSSTNDAFERFAALTNKERLTSLGTNAYEEDLRKVDNISLSSPRVFVDRSAETEPDAKMSWEAVLHPQGNRGGRSVAIGESGLRRWHEAVQAANGTVYGEYERTVGGLTFSPVSLTSSEARRLSQFNGLRALRPFPAIRPRPTIRTRGTASVRAPGTLEPLRNDISIAVFDGGVEKMGRRTTLFAMPEYHITPSAPDPDDEAHGTAVVGAALYGLMEAGSRAPRPAARLDSYRVFPEPQIPGDIWSYWLLDQIVEVVKREKYDIVNLSLGPEKAVEDFAEPDRWTAELDQIAEKQGTLFIVAAGNGGEYDKDGEFHRVQIPADMVNGLTVGSATLPHPQKRWTRATYSSMGPGRYGRRIQPTGLQYGGTDDEGMPLMRADGTLMKNYGTSFAAPLMTHAVSRLAAEFPSFNANTLKAFAVHFAERHRAFKSLVNELGFGRFLLDYTGKLEAEADQFNVLFEDKAVRSTVLGYQIPLPSRTVGAIELWITLSYTSPVDAAQSTDYTNSSIDLTLRPHSEMRRYTSPSDENVSELLDRRSGEAFELLTKGWKDSQEAPSKSLTALVDKSETRLREAGKWETLRHYRVKLPAGEAMNPRVEVTHLARRDGVLEDNVDDLPFSMLISVIEPGATDLHGEVARAFPSLQALANVGVPVQIQTQGDES
jgi:subtilisin family serine protease